jgi:hypothetical protein
MHIQNNYITPATSQNYMISYRFQTPHSTALYRLLTFHVPNHMSHFRFLGRTKVSAQDAMLYKNKLLIMKLPQDIYTVLYVTTLQITNTLFSLSLFMPSPVNPWTANFFVKMLHHSLQSKTKEQFCNIRSQRKHYATLTGYVLYLLATMNPYKYTNSRMIRR